MTTCDDWLSTLETARSEREAAAEAQRWADRADAMGYLLTCLIEWGAPDPTPIAPDEANSCGLRFRVVGRPRKILSFGGYHICQRTSFQFAGLPYHEAWVVTSSEDIDPSATFAASDRNPE